MYLTESMYIVVVEIERRFYIKFIRKKKEEGENALIEISYYFSTTNARLR